MPFKSEAQRRYLYATNKKVAEKYAKHTPKGKKLPERVKQAGVPIKEKLLALGAALIPGGIPALMAAKTVKAASNPVIGRTIQKSPKYRNSFLLGMRKFSSAPQQLDPKFAKKRAMQNLVGLGVLGLAVPAATGWAIRSGKMALLGKKIKSIRAKGIRKTATSKREIHRLADKKGIPWDDDPKFKRMSKRVTGESCLDNMSPAQLKKMKKVLLEKGKEKTSAISEEEFSKLKRLSIAKSHKLKALVEGGGSYMPETRVVGRKLRDNIVGALVGGAIGGLGGARIAGSLLKNQAKKRAAAIAASSATAALIGAKGGAVVNTARNNRRYLENRGVYFDPLFLRARVTPEAEKKYLKQ